MSRAVKVEHGDWVVEMEKMLTVFAMWLRESAGAKADMPDIMPAIEGPGSDEFPEDWDGGGEGSSAPAREE
jgi:hypothetical protein